MKWECCTSFSGLSFSCRLSSSHQKKWVLGIHKFNCILNLISLFSSRSFTNCVYPLTIPRHVLKVFHVLKEIFL